MSTETLKLKFRWRARYPLLWLPYRINVPWQPVAQEGPYKAWRFLGREWIKRPWPEGRTREMYMRYQTEQRLERRRR